MNDSFRTNAFVRFRPETIACACIYLAARNLQIPLPNSPPWYSLFGATEAAIHIICRSILKLYTRHKPNVEELDKSVNDLKKVLMDAKLKAKDASTVMGATPPTASRTTTPDKMSNFSPLVRSDVRRLRSEDEKSDSSFGRDVPRIVRKRIRSRSRSKSRHKRSKSASHSPQPLVAARRTESAKSSSTAAGESRSRHDKERAADGRKLPRHASSSDVRKASPPSSSDVHRSKKPVRTTSPSKQRSPSGSPDWTAGKHKRSKLVSSPVVVSKSHKHNGHHRHGHSRSKERRVHSTADRRR